MLGPMYQVSTPCTPQDFRLFGFRCTIVFVPGSASGVALKSKLPYVAEYADVDGFCLDDLSKLIVMFAWGISLPHSLARKFVSQMHNPVVE